MKLGSIITLVVILAALSLYFFVLNPSQPDDDTTTTEPRAYVWSVDMQELQHITIILSQAEMSESFVKHEDRQWYFDTPDGSQVDSDRWGGGIPLILSGPGSNRIITEYATAEQLDIFGFNQLHMEIVLTMENGNVLNIEVADSTPDGGAYYVKVAESNAVYTVDYTWYDVLERLVLEPPYPSVESD